MGNSCCRAESPCGSAEERSGLLRDDSKNAVTLGESAAVGALGPQRDDGIRKTPDEEKMKIEVKAEAPQVKRSPKVVEKEPNNTQENGPLQKEVTKMAAESPRKGSENQENSTRAQDEELKDCPAEGGQAEHQACTLNSLQNENSTAEWEFKSTANPAAAAAAAAGEEEEEEEEEDSKAASVLDKVSARSSPTAKPVCPENHPETNTKHILVDTTPDTDEEKRFKVAVVAETSEEFSQNNEVISVPNSHIPAAACQVSSISAASTEVDKESQSLAAAEHPESSPVIKESAPEVTRSHNAAESSPGPEPTGLDHSQEQVSSSSVREPETSAPADSSESSKSDQDTKPDLNSPTLSSMLIAASEKIKDISEETTLKGQEKDGDVPEVKETEEVKKKDEKEVVEEEEEEVETPAGKEPEIQEEPQTEKKSVEDELGDSDEDLYRGAEELPASQTNKPAVLESALLKVEDRCSLAPAVDILSYSEREWKGNTAKSALIRKGYKEMSQRFSSLRRVRGDNYCALRATLFQVFSTSTQLPAWLQEDDITMLPKQLEAKEGLISQWTFPGECLQGDGTGDAIAQLKGYMELLRNKWQAAVDCSSVEQRQQLCEQLFQGGEEELGLLEALKLLMLSRAVELHGCMQAEEDVPLFCWLLFARDSSGCPRSFLSNHLSHVGLSAGLEQVEMFLLGYALHCTIQVYRLYKADTEEFVTFYPDDHKDEWMSVCLVTEDDRHYNVPVKEAPELHEELDSS